MSQTLQDATAEAARTREVTEELSAVRAKLESTEKAARLASSMRMALATRLDRKQREWIAMRDNINAVTAERDAVLAMLNRGIVALE